MASIDNQTPERSIGQLVSDASADLSTIVRSEIELAKVEIKADAQNAGKGAGMFAGAALFGLFGLHLLLFAAAWGIYAAGLPAWAGFLIIGAVVLIIAAVLALVGKKAIGKVKGKPERTIQNAQDTVEAVKPGS